MTMKMTAKLKTIMHLLTKSYGPQKPANCLLMPFFNGLLNLFKRTCG